MPSSPPFSPATVANTSRGKATWNTGGGSPYTASLETPATNPPYDESDHLDFGQYFNSPSFPARIPTGLTARVTWTVVRSVTGAAGAQDFDVYVLISGAPYGSNLAQTGVAWPGTNGSVTYEAEVPAAAVNDNTLGLRIAADHTGSGIAVASVTSAQITNLLPLIPLQEGGTVASDDDGQAADDGTGYSNSGTAMRAGIVPGTLPPPDLPYAAFLRIPNIDIPAGSTITHAYFHLYDHGGDATDIEIGIVADASAVAPANATEVWDDVDNNLTTTQVTWPLSSSAPSEPYPIVTSPDCAALLTEFLALGGYTAGSSDLLVYFYGNGGSVDYHDFGTSDGYEAGFLTVEYTEGGGGGGGGSGTAKTSAGTFLLFIE